MTHDKSTWQHDTYDPALKRAPERKREFATSSEIAVAPLYDPTDVDEGAYAERVGYPGHYPYTRGIQPTMYRSRLWTMRQYAGFASADESNRRYRYLLEQGQTGLSVAFDLPTQIGYDSDDAICEGEVGKVGVAIDSLEDMMRLMDGIPLDKVSTSMTINASASVLLAMYYVAARRQGVRGDQLNGTVQNDILKEYIARGTYIYPPRPSLRLITDMFAFCGTEIPNWNTISISGYHIREAGATAAQELAFTLANAVTYVQAAIDAGLNVDDFAGRLSFFFNSHNNLLEEVAKFRAARRMWARIMREQFGATNPKSWMLRFHTQTAGSTLTAQQPYNNVVRTTIQALAAVFGGTQSLHTNSWDEALSLPSQSAAELALRTQQVIAAESGAADTIDPLAGSYYVESLTDALEAKARAYMDHIAGMGGSLRAIEEGYMQKEIQESAYRYQRDLEEKEQLVVGVNQYVTAEPPVADLPRVDPSVREMQSRRIADLRARRDNAATTESLAALEAAARGTENLMPHIVTCVDRLATIGEICNRMRAVFGEYHPATFY